ncbi:MAG: type II toxin-antitoxin system RelE/ParE family toxin [Armatimonadetes bacterium]|nr:type II toxin-antitoxin system RelE/ParE family toxin [Armatimonadota bacterium]
MAYTVTILPAAERQLANLPPDVRARLVTAIAELADNPRPGPPLGRKLQAPPPRYRLKLPPYRVIYTADTRAQRVEVVWVGLRRDAYRR